MLKGLPPTSYVYDSVYCQGLTKGLKPWKLINIVPPTIVESCHSFKNSNFTAKRNNFCFRNRHTQHHELYHCLCLLSLLPETPSFLELFCIICFFFNFLVLIILQVTCGKLYFCLLSVVALIGILIFMH